MYVMINLLVSVLFGVAAAAIAGKKNRSVPGWFFGGFFLGVIGIVIIAVLKDPLLEHKQQQRVEQENRRLREQLQQERIKSETFRKYTTARLDAHDNHLGVDTRELEGGDDSCWKPRLAESFDDNEER